MISIKGRIIKVDAREKDIFVSEVSKQLKVSEWEFSEAFVELKACQEAKYIQTSKGEKCTLDINGSRSYENEKYLKEYQKERNSWHQRHPIQFALYIAIFSAALSVLTGYIQQRIDNQSSKNQQLQELLQKVQNLQYKVDSIIAPQYH